MDSPQRRAILIADDNKDLAISLATLLKLVGFKVETVHNGCDALAVARLRRPDILLLDIGLPGIDGYQVAAEFRSDAKLRDVYIIAISGYSPGMLKGRSRQVDFDHYLVKPVEFSDLLPLLSPTVEADVVKGTR
jgi:CheY-like chemotaxis protein